MILRRYKIAHTAAMNDLEVAWMIHHTPINILKASQENQLSAHPRPRRI